TGKTVLDQLNAKAIPPSEVIPGQPKELVAVLGRDQGQGWVNKNQQLRHDGIVYAVTVSRDGRRLASAGADQTVRLWSAKKMQPEAVLKRHEKPVMAVEFSPDGSQLVSGDRDGKLIFWDVETGTVLRTIKAHGDQVNGVAFAPDGQRVLSTSTDKTACL